MPWAGQRVDAPMALYFVILAICLVIIGGSIALMMTVHTPRYRTEPQHLLRLFERVLAHQANETEWHATIGYPIRHDPHLEDIRRRAQRIMDEHGRSWQVARGGSLLSRPGHEELRELYDRLSAQLIAKEGRREF